MRYVDTSVFVSALLPEVNSSLAVSWFASVSGDELAISPWVDLEFSGALSRKLRMGRITTAEHDDAQSAFQSTFYLFCTTIEIETVHFSLAAQICSAHLAAIRPGDALHLAAASHSGLTLCTFDKSFASGAASLGYPVELIA